ncbi:hypothetical protein [Chitinophaga nivalis]|uniref:PD-(D/E)XK nuclease family protein n=1 Tax=Chitinophaga nivalis TaxID=2991709 RepID=A0ABT3IFC9_9BACT|nr:hypothetical protein [Chitinophaga nivalis]MCW3467651.1 hypothetical protein [Chitinophaga nivalis]MCW3482657.1 hypothetical protein [Chitinophaga nivalis]
MITKSEYLTIHIDTLLVRERQDRFITFLNGAGLPAILKPSMIKFAQIALASLDNRTVDQSLTTDYFDLDPAVGAELDRIISLDSVYVGIFEDKSASAILNEVWARLFKVALKMDYDRFYISEADKWMQAWLEEQWANAIAEISRPLDCKQVLTIIKNTELLYNFIRFFITLLPNKWLESDWLAWTRGEERPEKMMVHLQHEDYIFEQYCRPETSVTEPMEWALLKRMQVISQHLTFSEEFSLKGYVLRERNVAMWIQYWDNLRHPILQAAALNAIKTDEKIRDILSALISGKKDLKTPPSELALLLLDKFFHLLRYSWQMLTQYEQDSSGSASEIFKEKNELMQSRRLALQEWKVYKPVLGREIVTLIKEVASPIYIADWLFEQRPESNGHPAYAAHCNIELEFFRTLLKPLIASIPVTDQIELLEKKFSFYRVKFITGLLDGINDTDENKKRLLEILKQHLKADKYIWLGVFDERATENLNITANVIVLLSDPRKQYQSLLDEYCTNFEGWNVQTENFGSAAARESFLYAATIPYFERGIGETSVDEDILFFKEVLDKIIRQNRFSGNIKYYTPVIARMAYTAEILGVQEVYDAVVITKVDSLFEVLEMLQERTGSISEGNKDLLKERVDREMVFERLKLREANPAHTLKRMDEILETLRL